MQEEQEAINLNKVPEWKNAAFEVKRKRKLTPFQTKKRSFMPEARNKI